MRMTRIGTSGWMYDHWKGSFYPEDVESDAMLPFYAQTFDTVEVNNTFYQLPSTEKVRRWEEDSPAGFLFVIKANRYITHMKNLLDPEEPVNTLMDRVENLGEKLGPILFQLPPQWNVNAERLADFLEVLPQGPRFAFEFRDESWYIDEIYRLLEEAEAAFCIHDHRDAPSPEEVTTDFVYVRFHGPRGDYGGKYREEDLREWAEKIAGWQEAGRDVCAYFNNDMRGYAVENARELRRHVGE
jgi:uncharacterized protein YecE (DUF72 family)